MPVMWTILHQKTTQSMQYELWPMSTGCVYPIHRHQAQLWSDKYVQPRSHKHRSGSTLVLAPRATRIETNMNCTNMYCIFAQLGKGCRSISTSYLPFGWGIKEGPRTQAVPSTPVTSLTSSPGTRNFSHRELLCDQRPRHLSTLHPHTSLPCQYALPKNRDKSRSLKKRGNGR